MGVLGKIAGAGLGALGAGISSRGSRKAAKRASKAQQKAIQEGITTQEQAQSTIDRQQNPYRVTGMDAQNRLLYLLGMPGVYDTASGGPEGNILPPRGYGPEGGGENWLRGAGKYGRDFNMSDFQEDPGYSFRLKEGLKALDRQAAARGGLISGSALKAATNYGQEAASEEYQNAFNRYQVNRSNQLDPLYRMMGAGQNATNFLGNSRLQTASNISNLRVGKGEVKASGIIGQQDAKNSGIDAVTNAITSALPF